MKRIVIFISVFFAFLGNAQTKKIELLSADISTADEEKYPDAIILIGKVKMAHEGAILNCKKALLYREKNLFKAMGEVVMEQGDSIIQYSDFASYNGNTKIAKSWGHVEANDKTMKLSTDTLYFDRQKQIAYYPNNGTIRDKKNTLKSRKGTYHFKDKKFTAKTNVEITNPDNIINSKELDYYTNKKLLYIRDATTIINKKDNSKIYSEKGFYDTNKGVAYSVKNTKFFLKNGRTISADSLYYDKIKSFGSITNNIKITDSINKMVTKGNYAEIFKKKDSLFITKNAISATLMDKDSIYIHGDTIMITGKPKQRKVRTFHNVKIFKKDLQGKCDSIYSDQILGRTKMYKNPILWANKGQITGDSIQFSSNKETKKLDSLFVYNNAFMVHQDSIDNTKFNQIKGRNMFGKFEKKSLKKLLVKGNAESLYYNRNEKSHKLETITKMIASDIEFSFINKKIEEVKYIQQTEGTTFPPSKFPNENEKFKGFIWRENERPNSKEDIFKISETPLDTLDTQKPTLKQPKNTPLKHLDKAQKTLMELKDINLNED